VFHLKLTAVSEEELSLFDRNRSNQKELFEKLPVIFARAEEIIPLYMISANESDKQRKLGSWHSMLKMIEGQNTIIQYLMSKALTKDRIHYLKSFKKLQADLDDRETVLQRLKNSNHEKALEDLPAIFTTSFHLFKNHHQPQLITDMAFSPESPQQEKALETLRNLAKTIMQTLKICTLKDIEAPEMESEHQQALANAYMIPNVMILRGLLSQFFEP